MLFLKNHNKKMFSGRAGGGEVAINYKGQKQSFA